MIDVTSPCLYLFRETSSGKLSGNCSKNLHMLPKYWEEEYSVLKTRIVSKNLQDFNNSNYRMDPSCCRRPYPACIRNQSFKQNYMENRKIFHKQMHAVPQEAYVISTVSARHVMGI